MESNFQDPCCKLNRSIPESRDSTSSRGRKHPTPTPTPTPTSMPLDPQTRVLQIPPSIPLEGSLTTIPIMSTDQRADTQNQHLHYLKQALAEAQKSPPKPSNFRVGCVLVSFEDSTSPSILSTGYTLELEGNTHAEQCALFKLAVSHDTSEVNLSSVLTPKINAVLYTTLEPCGKRLSGNTPCVQRIIGTRRDNPEGGIRKVVFGAKEPGTFVRDSQSCRTLTEAGVEWEYVSGLDEEILNVAMEGHVEKHQSDPQEQKSKPKEKATEQPQGTNVDDISPEERKRQDAQPRNPKKRMMEAPPRKG